MVTVAVTVTMVLNLLVMFAVVSPDATEVDAKRNTTADGKTCNNNEDDHSNSESSGSVSSLLYDFVQFFTLL